MFSLQHPPKKLTHSTFRSLCFVAVVFCLFCPFHQRFLTRLAKSHVDGKDPSSTTHFGTFLRLQKGGRTETWNFFACDLSVCFLLGMEGKGSSNFSVFRASWLLSIYPAIKDHFSYVHFTRKEYRNIVFHDCLKVSSFLGGKYHYHVAPQPPATLDSSEIRRSPVDVPYIYHAFFHPNDRGFLAGFLVAINNTWRIIPFSK